jgi:hypothetical protein
MENGSPAHIIASLIDTPLVSATVVPGFGNGFTVTVPVADCVQPVDVTVTVTVYAPPVVVVKLATLPGLVTPPGTVQAYVTPVFGLAVAVTVAVTPAHIVGLFTLTVGTAVVLVTLMVLVSVQLAAVVTVTVYMPAALTVAVFVPATGVAPALQI